MEIPRRCIKELLELFFVPDGHKAIENFQLPFNFLSLFNSFQYRFDIMVPAIRRSRPITSERLWCMQCFRDQLTAQTPVETETDIEDGTEAFADPDEPITISCSYSGVTATPCNFCIKPKKSCEHVDAGMVGDAADFNLILDWASLFWHPVSSESPLSEDWAEDEFLSRLKRAVCNLGWCFENALTQHRTEHNLTDSKRATLVYISFRYHFGVKSLMIHIEFSCQLSAIPCPA
jgi:hypothetical protein